MRTLARYQNVWTSDGGVASKCLRVVVASDVLCYTLSGDRWKLYFFSWAIRDRCSFYYSLLFSVHPNCPLSNKWNICSII